MSPLHKCNRLSDRERELADLYLAAGKEDSFLRQKIMRYFIRSLRFALNGIWLFFRRERNGQIQGVMAMLVIAAGFLFRITKIEWMVMLVCTGLVISLEMLNSAIERICNMYTTDFHPAIKIIKDIAAAAVLWSALISLAVGLLIFVPYIVRLL